MTSVSGFWIKTSEKSRGVGFDGRRFDVQSDPQIISKILKDEALQRRGSHQLFNGHCGGASYHCFIQPFLITIKVQMAPNTDGL